jgi:diguanylate cyclase (GGDEF)-like protein
MVQHKIKNQMILLQQQFHQELPKRIEELESCWLNVKKRDVNSSKAGKAFLMLLHNMVGAGATFGFQHISEKAKKLENFILSAPPKHEIEVMRAVEQCLGKLRDIAALPPDAIDCDVPSRSIHKKEKSLSPKLIYIVEGNVEMGKALAIQLHYYGFDVQGFSSIKDLMSAIKRRGPDAVIMDMEIPEGPYAGTKAIKYLRENGISDFPVIYTSSREDFAARLEAERAGCDGYFLKPIDVGGLIDKLDHLLSFEEIPPYRVLIVDDMASIAEFYALILQEFGMRTFIVTDPMKVLEQIKEFYPELILMDVYMPACRGEELARIIRHKSEFISIPIVYLSAENNIHKQLIAMRHGGDDFLTKPIDPEHLVASISIRIDRYRILRSLMVRDGLTGLLNHSRIEEELRSEVARVEREGGNVTYVMIDLDNFKAVNDTYGHRAGDQVLQSLSRMLRDRLRGTDRIGRYGGEEFAIVFPNTTTQEAEVIMNNVREAFSKIIHCGDNEKTFNATMSCGIACYSKGDITDIGKLADRALYEAKDLGRNRIVVHDNLKNRPKLTPIQPK